jgi:hypothetical protein
MNDEEDVKKVIEKLKEGGNFEFTENVDLSKDPVISVWWKHFTTALYCFANTNISYEDAFQRYKKLMYSGYLFLKKGMKTDENDNAILSEKEDLSKIIEETVKLLLKQKRKIRISIRL